ncbi:MAG: FtsX-like permease family protein [Clostridia bacterium]|nr:FtsX-like permease family protein [Clostridia bacterium]
MNRLTLLAGANLRRERWQTAVFLVLLLIGAAVLNLWLMLATDYRANFDRWHEQLHAEDVLLLVPGPDTDTAAGIRRILEDCSDVTEYEVDPGITVTAAIPYSGGTVSSPAIILPADKAVERRIGRVDVTAEAERTADGLYYPILYQSDELPLGQTAAVEIDAEKRVLPVAGFINSVMAGSHNCSIILLLAGGDLYAEMAEEAVPATLVSARLQNPERSEAVRGELVEALQEELNLPIQGTDYMRNRRARYAMQMIITAILSAAVCLELVVVTTVAASNVASHIQQSMTELGLLKGIGYTGSELVGALVFQYILLSLPACFAGSALAYTVYPVLSDLMSAQTGIPYAVHFLPGPFLLSSFAGTGVVAAAVWLAARRIQYIEPITALRSGVETHSFRRSPLPLAKIHLPMNAALGLKNSTAFPKRNITICVTMAALTLLIVFAATMVTNMLISPEPVLDLIGIERADLRLDVAPEAAEKLTAYLQGDSRTQNFYMYTQDTGLPEPGGPGLWPIVIEDSSELQNQEIIYEGRLPVYDNETAVGAKHALERGLHTGDMIEFGSGGDAVSYLITGLTQGTNYLGDEAYFTRAGYERLMPLSHVSYYVTLRSAGSEQDMRAAVDAYTRDVEAAMDESLNSAEDLRSMLSAVTSVYVTAMRTVVWILAVLTIILTVLVMVLLTRTALNAQMHEYGIMKAIGYTSRDLAVQTAVSFLPALAISEAAGLILWSLTCNLLVSLFLRGLGTMRCSFTIPGALIAGAGVLLMLLALAVILLMARRIRRADPVQIMQTD